MTEGIFVLLRFAFHKTIPHFYSLRTMILDLISALILLACAVEGYKSGFIRQVFSIAGLFVSYFGALPTSKFFRSFLLSNSTQTQPVFIEILIVAVFAILLYLLTLAVGRFIYKTLVRGIKPIEKTNKILGCSLSILKMLAILYATFCLFDYLKTPVTQHFPQSESLYSSSYGIKFAQQSNFLKSLDLPAYEDFQNQIQSVSESIAFIASLDNAVKPQGNPADNAQQAPNVPDLPEKITSAQQIQEIYPNRFTEEELKIIETMLQNENFKALLNDPSVRADIAANNTHKLLTNPNVIQLLGNKEFMRNAQRISWKKHLNIQ